jgi:hypothetical protein
VRAVCPNIINTMGCGRCTSLLVEKPNHSCPAIHINDQPINLSKWSQATPVMQITKIQDPLYGTDFVIKSCEMSQAPESMNDSDFEAQVT